MDYASLTRKLPQCSAPTRLTYEDLVATAITRDDLAEDVRGINASLELIQRTRGGGWPTEPVTEEFNFVDVVWHELEFRDGYSYTYVVRDAEGGYVGCAYLYPMGRRTELTEALLRTRRRRQLVGDAGALRTWALRAALPRPRRLAGGAVPVHRALLLQRAHCFSQMNLIGTLNSSPRV